MVSPPTIADWFDVLQGDVEDLRGTNNYVEIFNTGSEYSKRGMLLFSQFDVSKKFPGRKKCKASDLETGAGVHRALVLVYVTTFEISWSPERTAGGVGGHHIDRSTGLPQAEGPFRLRPKTGPEPYQ